MKINRLASVATENDVVETAGVVNAWFACHIEIIPVFFNLSTWKPDPAILRRWSSYAG